MIPFLLVIRLADYFAAFIFFDLVLRAVARCLRLAIPVLRGHPQIPPVHYAISVLTESRHFAFTDHFPRATTGDAFDGITLNSNGSSFGSKRPDCASRAATRTSAVLVSAHLKTVLALNHHMNYYTNIEQTRCEQFFCSKRNS